jgi:hypothetical protein
MTVINPPASMQQRTDHTAQMDRLALEALLATSAVSLGTTSVVRFTDGNDLKVVATGPATMNVIVKAGGGFVEGTENVAQGAYFVFNDADVTLAIAAANATNPRLDAVVFTVRDSFYSGANNDSLLQVIQGTAAASPVLPTLPNNSMLLGQVSIPANATTIPTGNITDRRVRLSPIQRASNSAVAQVTTTSLTNVGLAGGPTVTVNLVAGQVVEVRVSARMWNDVGPSHAAVMGFNVTGVETQAQQDADSCQSNDSDPTTLEKTSLYTAAVTGSHTFTAGYRAITAGTTAFFLERRLMVIG